MGDQVLGLYHDGLSNPDIEGKSRIGGLKSNLAKKKKLWVKTENKGKESNFSRISFADGMVGCRVDTGKEQDTWNLTFLNCPTKIIKK